jgi:hypothetical protein
MPANFRVVAGANGAFAVAVPNDWQVQQQGQGVQAMHPQGAASLMAMAAPRQAQSLQQFVQQMCQGFQQSVPNWKSIGQQNMQVSGQQAVHVRATGQPQGMNLVADYVFVVTQQRQFVLMLSAQQASAQQLQGTFGQIIGTFQVR